MPDNTQPSMAKPNPGSDAAVNLGCICPRSDNNYGKGAYGVEPPVFWINGGCPIHDTRQAAE